MKDYDTQRSYLQRVLAKTGWTQTQLAQRAGLDPSTLSRFLSAEREGHALRASTLTKIGTASGVSPDGESSPPPPPGFAEAEASPLAFAEGDQLSRMIASLASPDRSIDPWSLTSRALENAGYRSGDVLLVALDEAPRPGDLVCAQVYDWSKGGAQTLFRLYQPPYLVAATSDPALMRPFSSTDANVVIKGVVVASLRGRHTL